MKKETDVVKYVVVQREDGTTYTEKINKVPGIDFRIGELSSLIAQNEKLKDYIDSIYDVIMKTEELGNTYSQDEVLELSKTINTVLNITVEAINSYK